MVEMIGVILAIVASITVAIQVLFVRIGTVDGAPLDALAVVLSISTMVIVSLAAFAYYPAYNLTGLAILAFIGAGITGTFLGMVTYFTSIKRLGASRTEPIKASMPLYATLLAVALLGETLTGGNLVGVVLIVLGVALVSWESHTNSMQEVSTSLWTITIPIATAILFGIEPIFAKIGFAEGTPAIVGLAVKTLAAWGALLGYLWWRGSLVGMQRRLVTNLHWYLAAAFAYTAFLLSFYLGLAIAPVVVVIPLFQTSPLVVIILSAVFLRRLERITPRLVLGATVVVIGAVAVTLFG